MRTKSDIPSDNILGIYLREIGKVPLLAPHQEVWLSIQQEANSCIEAFYAELSEQEGPEVVNQRILNWDRVASLDLSTMPQPHIEYPHLTERFSEVMWDAVLLVGITGVFLMLGILRVVRYTP